MACSGYSDILIHISGRYVAASCHWEPIRQYIKGSETAPKDNIQMLVTNIVVFITFLYAATMRSFSSCISDRAGNETRCTMEVRFAENKLAYSLLREYCPKVAGL